MSDPGWRAFRISTLPWAVTLTLGLLTGIGLYTFVYARGGPI